jgi:hypothetical protein
MCDKRVLCKDCKRWYSTRVDQCNIPASGIQYYGEKNKNVIRFLAATGEIDIEKMEFIANHLDLICFTIYSRKSNDMTKKEIYGSPSALNRENNCPFFIDKNPPKKMTFWEWLKIQLS